MEKLTEVFLNVRIGTGKHGTTYRGEWIARGTGTRMYVSKSCTTADSARELAHKYMRRAHWLKDTSEQRCAAFGVGNVRCTKALGHQDAHHFPQDIPSNAVLDALQEMFEHIRDRPRYGYGAEQSKALDADLKRWGDVVKGAVRP